MSGDDHGTGELDLDAIEARAARMMGGPFVDDPRLKGLTRRQSEELVMGEDVPALVAEVRRLRNVLGVVTAIKDRLLEESYAEHPEIPHP